MSLSKWLSEIFTPSPKAIQTVAISALFSIFLGTPAFAEESADVSILLRAGQLGEALEKADEFLAKRPHDVQMRFLKGLILTEKHKIAEAIGIFVGLSEDFPDSPEPFNNLAVLFAANGQFEKARGALEAAMRTHPTYATAYKNLNSVQARLARQAGMPQPLGGENTSTSSKLTLIRSLEVNAGNIASTRSALAPVPLENAPPVTITDRALKTTLPGNPAVQEPAILASDARLSVPTLVATANQQLAKADSKPDRFVGSESTAHDQVPKVVKGWSKALTDEHLADVRVKLENQDDGDASTVKANDAGRNNFETIAIAAIAAAAPTPPASEAKTAAPPLGTTGKQEFARTDSKPERSVAAGNEEADRDHVLNVVNGWSKAWSGHDTEKYLSYYSKDFQTPNRESITAWENKRRVRISGQSRTSIEIDSPHVLINGPTALVRFRQIYISENFKSDIYKILTFTRKNGEWKIVKERIDN